MQHIYNEEKDDLEKSFADIKKVFDHRTFKYEVLIAFWLTIHLQKLEASKLVYDLDPIIEKVVKNLRNAGKAVLDEKRAREEEERKRGVLGFFAAKKNSLANANYPSSSPINSPSVDKESNEEGKNEEELQE